MNAQYIDTIKQISVRGDLRFDFPLADFTWLRVGGRAECFFMPADEQDLACFLQKIPDEVPLYVIGAASNLLVRDGGVPGVVIRLGAGFRKINFLGCEVICGSAMPAVKVAMACLTQKIGGLEFFSGIPGTIGGVITMNAGANGCETSQVFVSCRVMDRAGAINVIYPEQAAFKYRGSVIDDKCIILSGHFKGYTANLDIIRSKMNEVKEHRSTAQPVRFRTAGSTFRNPNNNKAWKLIDDAGCRGLQVGKAHISHKHANFILTEQGATAADVEKLGNMVIEKVKNNSGIKLQWEIMRIGMQNS